ncbi:MAG TPA: anhydro-N-acetylmuramic acid kinase [Stellaceae bacterium]|jgi:anhydro-N-acetylmuramic acid kinase|nr:anhydro-N-acetylmuramic acid kinase [Stellaceae bacterium]
MSARRYRVIGLMSGTSLDGIDAALITTDGVTEVEIGPALTLPYDPPMRATLRGVAGGQGDVAAADWALTQALAAAVTRLREQHRIDAVDLIGCHGHTILHRPRERQTWQIGNGELLARLAGTDTVCDFRSADVADGGEGAPLAPLYHAALAAGLPRPLAVLNIGGVANVTWVGEGADELLAFDTGPGNALIDDWAMRHTGAPIDRDGALARQGNVDEAAVARLLAQPYFARRPPKSLDRDEFADLVPRDLSPADGAATLTAMTVAAVCRAAEHFPAPVKRWLVTGGGRHNPALMAALAEATGSDVSPVETAGWDGDALEAQAFAYLAVRSVSGLPLSLPTTTGVTRPLTGGRLFRGR